MFITESEDRPDGAEADELSRALPAVLDAAHSYRDLPVALLRAGTAHRNEP